MDDLGIEPGLLEAWVVGRSLARGVAVPVWDRGGLRVDTRGADEVCRWIFPRLSPAVGALARDVALPGYLLKVCCTVDALRAALPATWQTDATGYFMSRQGGWDARPLPPGYVLEAAAQAGATHIRVLTARGELAASGYAAETAQAFVYDRIVTAPAHRRIGLGGALMTALRRTCRDPDLPGLLVATEPGRALYATLGWQNRSRYATASVRAAAPHEGRGEAGAS